ncbi:9729_t:CDS:2, partial [Acaulospora colombiana]
EEIEPRVDTIKDSFGKERHIQRFCWTSTALALMKSEPTKDRDTKLDQSHAILPYLRTQSGYFLVELLSGVIFVDLVSSLPPCNCGQAERLGRSRLHNCPLQLTRRRWNTAIHTGHEILSHCVDTGYPALLNDYITRRIVSDSQLYPHRTSAGSDSSEVVGWKRVGNPALEESDAPMFEELLAIHSAELDFLKNNLLSARKIVDAMKSSPSQLVGDPTSSQPLSSTEVIYDTAVQTLQGIETHMKTVEVLMKNLEGLKHPIRTLPTELLKIIMEAAVEADEQERRASIFFPPNSIHEANLPTRSNTLMGDDLGSLAIRAHHSRDYRRSGYAKVPTAVLLSHVCRRWREVACSTPSLWRIIRYSLSGQPDSGFKSWDRVRLFLQRADHDPLSPNNRAIDHGISLIFTNWMEHTHPPPADSLRKVMRMLSKPDRTEREWTTETPSHSRRQSAANSTFNAMTPPLGDLNEYVDPEQSFIIKRFEIVFDTLCEHPNLLGSSRNAELLWPTGCPRPKEVAYIARDNVYKQPPHDDEDIPDILIPPYAKSLIPWAKDVTLYNLRYPWPEMEGESAYKRLNVLRIHFTCDFERLLEKPRSEDNLGFLQFLKMAPNLTELEIRLPQRTGISSSDLSTIRRPDPQSSTPPPLKTSLNHLLISYRDLLEIIPLFMPNPAHPS